MTSRTILTDLLIRALPTPSQVSTQYPDAKCQGFGIRVSSKGVKTFYYRYELNGSESRMTIGRYPDIKLAEARLKADQARILVKAGINPNPEPEPQAADDAPSPAATPLNARTAANNRPEGIAPVLFTTALKTYLDIHCPGHARQSTINEYRYVLTKHYGRPWASRTVCSIKKSDVIAVIERAKANGHYSAARHAQKSVMTFFKWCRASDYILVSPCEDLPTPPKAKRRKRLLTDHEIRRVWEAAKAEGYPFGPITQLAILTAQRRGEVVGMRWEELDFAEAIWTIPGTRTKNGEPNIVPLSTLSLSILSEIKRMTALSRDQAAGTSETSLRDLYTYYCPAPSPYVFPSKINPRRPFAGINRAKTRINNGAQIDHWVIHDLRRTTTTQLGSLNVPKDIQKRIINHSQNSDVTAIYDLYRYTEQQRKALQSWADKLLTIIEHQTKDENETLLLPFDTP